MENSTRFNNCSICSQLAEHEYAFRKGGQEQDDTHLPAASDRLELVRDVDRAQQLKRCPQCGTYYLYKFFYEFLVYGSEDEEFLDRLSDEAARKYLDQPD